jgi:hypothetical protein
MIDASKTDRGITMPFVPLTPDEEREFRGPCRHPQHDPPNHMVIHRPMKWVCPGCGHLVIIRPPVVTWRIPGMGARTRLTGLDGEEDG